MKKQDKDSKAPNWFNIIKKCLFYVGQFSLLYIFLRQFFSKVVRKDEDSIHNPNRDQSMVYTTHVSSRPFYSNTGSSFSDLGQLLQRRNNEIAMQNLVEYTSQHHVLPTTGFPSAPAYISDQIKEIQQLQQEIFSNK